MKSLAVIMQENPGSSLLFLEREVFGSSASTSSATTTPTRSSSSPVSSSTPVTEPTRILTPVAEPTRTFTPVTEPTLTPTPITEAAPSSTPVVVPDSSSTAIIDATASTPITDPVRYSTPLIDPTPPANPPADPTDVSMDDDTVHGSPSAAGQKKRKGGAGGEATRVSKRGRSSGGESTSEVSGAKPRPVPRPLKSRKASDNSAASDPVSTSTGSIPSVTPASAPVAAEATPEKLAIRVPADAAAYITNGVEMFTSVETLRTSIPWMQMLQGWVDFEVACKFASSPALAAKNRPPVVGEWIARARAVGYKGSKTDPVTYGQIFRVWYITLQPVWRTLCKTSNVFIEAEGERWVPTSQKKC